MRRAVLLLAAVIAAAPVPAAAADWSCPADLTTGQCVAGTSIPPPPPGYSCWYEIVMDRLHCLLVPQPGSPSAQTQALRVVVPERSDIGLSWEIEGNDTVTLTAGAAGYAGEINPVRVTDRRETAGGWSASGQATAFTGPAEIPASALEWTPRVLTAGAGAVAGPVADLDGPAVLASAPAGRPPGEARLGADLLLTPPPGSDPGPYLSTLTLTVLGL